MSDLDDITATAWVPSPPKIEDRYTAGCAFAAAHQGLASLAYVLDALGVPVEMMQTGGFTMVLAVTKKDEPSFEEIVDPTRKQLWTITNDTDGTNGDMFVLARWTEGQYQAGAENPLEEVTCDSMVTVVENLVAWAT